MKKYILFVVSAIALAFTSCSDSEEIDILYQNEIEIKVDQLIASFREAYEGDFDINEYHSLRVQSYIYDENGELVTSTNNYVQNFSTITKFSHKLQDGKYTIMTFASFVEGTSSPKSDADVLFSSWDIRNTSKLNDLEMISSPKKVSGIYGVVGAAKTELEIDGSQAYTIISVKPLTCLIYFDVDYMDDEGRYLRAETLEILGERINDMASWENNEWVYDSSFKIGSVTSVVEMNPINDINDGYTGFVGYRAYLPTNNMRFWFIANILTNDGNKFSIDSSDENNAFTSTYYTDTYNLEAGKQYIIKLSCAELSMTLAPFLSTNSRSINELRKIKNENKTTSKVMEILK